MALIIITTLAHADIGGVASVVDADTIEVHGQRIRLYGVDAKTVRRVPTADAPAIRAKVRRRGTAVSGARCISLIAAEGADCLNQHRQITGTYST
jgi:hypothetical protein